MLFPAPVLWMLLEVGFKKSFFFFRDQNERRRRSVRPQDVANWIDDGHATPDPDQVGTEQNALDVDLNFDG